MKSTRNIIMAATLSAGLIHAAPSSATHFEP